MNPGGEELPGGRRLFLAFTVAAGALSLDQLTKWWAERSLAIRSVHVVGPLQLQLAHNTGIAFSIGQGLTAVVTGIEVLLAGAIAVFAYRARSRWVACALGLVLGGAVGNLVDRFVRRGGAVVDFIATRYWPTFNVADSCVVVGCAMLAWWALRSRQGSGVARR